MEKIIKNCRGIEKSNDGVNRIEKKCQRENFRLLLLFKENDIYQCKESSVLKLIMETFEGENMETQHSLLNYKIELYFHEYKLAVKIDENNHQGKNENYEKQRQKEIENKLSCVFNRINPDKQNFNISRAENEIFRLTHI